MKTTFDIPDDALDEAMRWSGAKTKREAIIRAINEFNRRRRVEKVIKMFGTFTSLVTNEEIEALDLERERAMFGHAIGHVRRGLAKH